MIRFIRTFYNDTRGATAIEYVLIASVISIAALGIFVLLGDTSSNQMTSVAEEYASVQ